MAEWYDKSCEDCGTSMRVCADWDNPPRFCKSCKAERAAKWYDKSCESCGSPHFQLNEVRDQLYDFFLVGYNIVCFQVVPSEGSWPNLICRELKKAEAEGLEASIKKEVEQCPAGFPRLPRLAWNFLDAPAGDIKDILKKDHRRFLARLYAILKLIDRVSSGACPWMRHPAPFAAPGGQYGAEGYELLRGWYQNYRRLNSSRYNDWVVFRPCPLRYSQAWWWRCKAMPHMYRAPEIQWRRRWINDEFSSLQVLRHYPDCPFDIFPKRQKSQLPRLCISSRPVLRIAVVPLVTDLNPESASYQPGELRLKISGPAASPARFTVTVDDESCTELCNLARKAIAECARLEAQFVVFPELVVPDAVVGAIQEALRASKAEGKIMPELVVAGTWLREEGSSPLRRNMAVVLDGHGNILDWKQSKMQAYTMSEEEQIRYGLDGWVERELGRKDKIQEDIATTPRYLNLFETDKDRMAILICEDLSQTQPTGRALDDLPVTYVFSPLMAGDLAVQGDFGVRARDIATVHAAVVVVGNFQGHIAALSRKDPKKKMNIGLVAQPFSRISDPNDQSIQEGVVAPIPAGTEIVQVLSIP